MEEENAGIVKLGSLSRFQEQKFKLMMNEYKVKQNEGDPNNNGAMNKMNRGINTKRRYKILFRKPMKTQRNSL